MNKKLMILATATVALATMSCTGNAESNATGGDTTANATEQTTETAQADPVWDIDFPKNLKIDVEQGQNVLVPLRYFTYAEEGHTISKYCRLAHEQVKEVRPEGVIVDNIKGVVVPNAVVVPIPTGQTAQEGDIIVTWLQKGGADLQRAIVTDASNPKQPKIVYTDLDWKEDGKGFANKYENFEVEENSFYVLKPGEWMPGASVVRKHDTHADEWVYYRLVHEADGKVLLMDVTNNSHVFPKSECKLVDLNKDIKVGDKVWYVFVSGFINKGGEVTKVDKKKGLVWLKDQWDKETICSILEVTKEL